MITYVAPFVGAWIEIGCSEEPCHADRSLPSWERGLKFPVKLGYAINKNVAPFVGAWIEIHQYHQS